MKVICSRTDLLAAVQAVSPAVAAKTTKPVLECIKVTAEGDTVTLVAHDLEVGIRYRHAGVQVPKIGSAVFDAGKLSQILRECDGSDVTLSATDDAVKVVVGGSRFELVSMPVDEFPDLPEVDANDSTPIGVDADELAKMIRLVSFAVDKKDSTRFALSGVLVEAEGKKLRLVATDSKRLAVCEGVATETDGLDPKRTHILPMKAINLLGPLAGVVEVYLHPTAAMFRGGAIEVHTRLLEGRYPPYRDIIKQCVRGDVTKITLPVDAFASAVRQAAIMSDRLSSRVDMSFEPGKVQMKARGADTGESEVNLSMPDYQGPVLHTAFDPRYLVEFFRAVKDESTVTLNVTTGDRPALFDGAGYRYLVMPLAG